jgi:Domain of unknown function (DUF1905)
MNEIERILIDQHLLVEKQEGKFGWRYVVISGIPAEAKNKIGLVRVRGSIDSYQLSQFHLLPMKDGNMLLPLKTAVRKKIAKKEGDTVHVILFSDDSPVLIPDDILSCLLDYPKAYQFFLSLSESNQKY